MQRISLIKQSQYSTDLTTKHSLSGHRLHSQQSILKNIHHLLPLCSCAGARRFLHSRFGQSYHSGHFHLQIGSHLLKLRFLELCLCRHCLYLSQWQLFHFLFHFYRACLNCHCICLSKHTHWTVHQRSFGIQQRRIRSSKPKHRLSIHKPVGHSKHTADSDSVDQYRSSQWKIRQSWIFTKQANHNEWRNCWHSRCKHWQLRHLRIKPHNFSAIRSRQNSVLSLSLSLHQ